MKSIALAGAVAAATIMSNAAAAQVTVISDPGSKPPAVPQAPLGDPEDTPEEIAKDAARDLKDNSFYNRPGATRAQYDADWQTCRLIARGSRTPGGTYVYVYNPAVISPVAAGIGAGIGNAIGAAIVEGQIRRANRRSCLMYKGWRRVEVSADRAAAVAKMSDADRDGYFNSIVGAEKVEGEVTELTSFSLAPDAALNLDAVPAGAASLAVARKTDDPRAPIALGEGEGALVMAFSRPDAGTAGRSGGVELYRYEMDKNDIAYQPRDWKKQGDLTTYSKSIKSKVRTAPYELHVVKLTAGHYVIGATTVGPMLPMSTNCFGAPVITVPAGKVVYLGDWLPFMNVRLSSGEKLFGALAWAPHLDRARAGLAQFQPALAERLEPAEIRNGATYSCAAVTMNKWELPGVPQLAAAAPVEAVAKVEAVTGEAAVTPAASTVPVEQPAAVPSPAPAT